MAPLKGKPRGQDYVCHVSIFVCGFEAFKLPFSGWLAGTHQDPLGPSPLAQTLAASVMPGQLNSRGQNEPHDESEVSV